MIDKYINALNKISPNIPRDDWVKTAMASKSAGIDFNTWDNWSSNGDTYNPKDAKSVWQSADATGGITGGTLLHMAGYEGKKNGAVQGTRNDYSQPGNTQPLDAAKRTPSEVIALFESYPDASESHAYIIKKQGWADDLKVVPDESKEMIRGVSLAGALVIPCKDGDNINTLQYITQAEKLNLANASFGDGYFMQGHDTQKIYVTEGIGQLWAAIEATGYSAVSTFGVSRTKKVVCKLKQLHPTSQIIICADAGKEKDAEIIARELQVKAVFMPKGWPKNSDINDLMLKEGIAAVKSILQNPQAFHSAFDIMKFTLNGQSSIMESNMLADTFILGRMAILGQWTVFYAKPNAGKTLLTVWMLIEAIKRGNIKGADVFYINADDDYKGLVYKLKLAEKYGFNMLAPSHNGFKAEILTEILMHMIKSNEASGKVIILDTLKKFNDIMHKSQSSAFGEAMRAFISHGGSVVALAHVNKNKNDEGKLVYGGVTDIVDDADCAYTLDTIKEDAGIRTVLFENFKCRGDNALTASFEYICKEGTPYEQRLSSVKCLTDDEVKAAHEKKKIREKLELNKEAIEAITACLMEGIHLKTELINAATENSMLSKAKIKNALKDHTGLSFEYGELWRLDIGDKNSHRYYLNKQCY